MTGPTPHSTSGAARPSPGGPEPTTPSGDGPLDVLEDALRALSRLCAVPTALIALAAFAVNFAPMVPISGPVLHVSRDTGRRSFVAPYRIVVQTPTGSVSAHADGPLGVATQPGDSAVVRATPVFGAARSVTVYRDGAEVGTSGRGAVSTWGTPLFFLAIAAMTLRPAHREDDLRVVVAAAFFNVGAVVAAVVFAMRAAGP